MTSKCVSRFESQRGAFLYNKIINKIIRVAPKIETKLHVS